MKAKLNSTYIPGMCNIGPAERRRRRIGGIVGTIVTVALLIILISAKVPHIWRLVLIVPASGAATGFLQDAFHFCAGFGMRGLYNVMNGAGVTDSVELEDFRKKDQRKARQIIALSLIAGIIFGVVAFVI